MINFSVLISGFVIGLAGSLHCVGMCGPLVLGFSAKNETRGVKNFMLSINYSLGRIVTYSAMGFVLGMFGEGIKLTGYQGIISVVTGLIILLAVITPKRWTAKFSTLPMNKLLLNLKSKLGVLLMRNGSPKPFLFGLLNGFLPCGLVYTALAAALVPGDIVSSVLLMAAFGAGTSPLLGALFFSKALGNIFSGFSISKYVPYVTIVVSILLILRGLDLGIPFISPQLHQINIHGSNCCSP